MHRDAAFALYAHYCVCILVTHAGWEQNVARVQLVIPDEDRDRFAHQARQEGMTFSAWLRAAARERLERKQQARRFESAAEIEAFWRECDEQAGPGREPDWEEHLKAINASRSRGATDT